jgi:Putative nucleotidyltransferase DUF294
MKPSPLQKHLNERAWRVLKEARAYCKDLVQKLTQLTDRFLAEKQLDPKNVCFAVVGSVGRFEALQASDVDFTPVLKNQPALDKFKEHDRPLRELIRQQLSLDVSKGEELTCPATLEELANPAKIGCTETGNEDNSSTLTRRILILTEGTQVGGKLPIRSIRKKIMKAYSGEDRSRGRHVLSLCNDLARYYRTLCIEYKSKVGGKEEKWGLRNMKLRHSRKFWFFSCVLTITHLAESNPHGDAAYFHGLLKAFDLAPYQRLLDSVEERLRGMVGRIIEPFAWFIEFMADKTRRQALENVTWADRYDMNLSNPFHAVKFNSDRLQEEMVTLIDSLPSDQRHQILRWFLL